MDAQDQAFLVEQLRRARVDKRAVACCQRCGDH